MTGDVGGGGETFALLRPRTFGIHGDAIATALITPHLTRTLTSVLDGSTSEIRSVANRRLRERCRATEASG
jgi:hypothetical protein